MREHTDGQLDLDILEAEREEQRFLDQIEPYEVLKPPFEMPQAIQHNGTTYYYPRVLPHSGAIAVIGEAGTDTAGTTIVFLARECCTLDGRPLLEVAREAADARAATQETRRRIADCCHSTTST